ncbi:nucleotidyltransferase substrate binding protein [Flavobacterium acetivorans]|uniref:nucleotidyltransferase substrate binding protein n=1 Tax=Flavobacterium acetivorans TaxID=2893883 RepID=UPI001E44C529|nr:nucleotidyltransferase substrate binding protein [Flavobacterium sp. F-29]UFH35760.1 nucleotidyltransferase substrate binding protein [Flavobacterium sp. F-29]
MEEPDIRWEQRLDNFNKALSKLNQIVLSIKKRDAEGEISDDSLLFGFEIVKEGLIQRFEYTHELAWKVMKDYAFFQGNPDIGGSRDAVREALQLHIIENGKIWMEMIASRNKTSHTYNEDTADEIFRKIIGEYHPAFMEFQKKMESKRNNQQDKD